MDFARKTKCDALLDLLADGRAHDQHEVLRAAGYRYTGRVKDLRDRGHNIESIHVRGSVWMFRLILPPPVEARQGVLLEV